MSKSRNSSVATRGANKAGDPDSQAEGGLSADPSSASKTESAATPAKQAGKKHKQKQEKTDAQTTLDKHLKSTETAENTDTSGNTLDATLRGLSEKLGELASQQYIEEMFKKLVTQEFLNKKLEELETNMKNQIKSEIEKVNKEVKILKDRMKTAEETTETVQNKLSDVETAMDKVLAENTKFREENKIMKKQLEERETVLKHQTEEINNLEQYTRRNSVRIYGVDDRDAKESHIETARHVVSIMKDKLNIKISTADIDIAHRMGRFQKDSNRPIICKFVSRATKHEVIKSRRQLKNTPIVIREDLTLKNAKLLEKTAACDHVRSAWSDEGRIIALLQNDKKIIVDGNTDLSSLRR